MSTNYPKYLNNHLSLFISVSLSHVSYTAALFHPLGFDAVLGVHILLCGISAISYCAKRNSQFGILVLKAFLSCAGFVVLKLADLYLAELHILFEIFSGHFLSKVCDVLQIYYVLLIMEAEFYGFETEDGLDKTDKVD